MVRGNPKRHFEVIAEAMKADEAARSDEAASLDPLERIYIGLRLGRAMPTDEAAEAELDRRALGQAELALKRRRLGLKRTRP